MKLCATCNTEKSEHAFHRKADARDGLHPHCKVCRKEKDAAYRLENLERAREYDKDRNANNVARRQYKKKQNRETYVTRKVELLARMAEYAKEKPHVVRAAKRAWKARNPARTLADTRRRQLQKRHAAPKWANTEFERFAIEEMYDLARRRTKVTGITWEVDHAVPIQNKLVCGLHCVANLQVIPAQLNAKKSNRVWPDMP